MYKALIERSKAVTIQYLRRTNGDKRIKIIIYHCFMILLRNYSLVRHLLIVCIIKQSFIQALLLTTVFYKGLSFMAVGHNLNPTCISTLTLAAGDLSLKVFRYLFHASFCALNLFLFLSLFFLFVQLFYTVDDF